jgi:hypothetical protein
VVMCVITHLPHQDGYHAKRLEVIQACIGSMMRGAPDVPLVVWDNGSHPVLLNWLRSLRPYMLIESANVGKANARAALFRMFPPETVVAMSDDDILFYPGWLDAEMDILQTFPNVACVTGNPIRTSFRWGCENTIRWMKDEGILEVGRFIPDEYEQDFCMSIGRVYETHRKNTANEADYRGQYGGVYAYATGHHCQFIAVAGRVLSAAKYDDYAMGDEKPFDIALDKIGLRLSTVKRYSRHIGNVIHDELRDEIRIIEQCRV